MNGCSERPPFYLTAYGLAVKHGFQGTEEEWINEQRAYVDAAETAAGAAEAASGQASGHAAAAAASASDAAAAAGRAGASARSAAAGAAAAAEKESEATAAALAAKDSKETASSAATAAASCAESANASKNAAQLSQQNAAASASAAAASAGAAANKIAKIDYAEYSADASGAVAIVEAAIQAGGIPHVVYDLNGKGLRLSLSGKQEISYFGTQRMNYIFTAIQEEVLYQIGLYKVISGGAAGWYSIAYAEMQPLLEYDEVPTSGSHKAITSGAVYTALDGKQATLSFDPQPKEWSQKMVKSDGIWQADHKRARIVDYGGNVGLIAGAYGDGSAVFCRYTKNGNDYLLPLAKAIEYGTATDGSKTYTFMGFDPNANLRYQTTAQQTVSQGVISTSWTVVYEIETIGSPPGTNGTYHLSATRTNDGVTYEWVADNS